MHIARRLACLLLPAALLGAALAPAGTSAALEPPPPTPTVTPADASDDGGPSMPAGDFLLAPPGCGSSIATPANNTGQNIPDAAGAVPGVITSTLYITTTGTFLWQLGVTTGISHSDSGDLDISLISPHHTVVTLSSNNGAGKANVLSGTTWYDTAATGFGSGVVTLVNFISGTVRSTLTPEEPLSALLGEDPNGLWQLVVKDTNQNSKKGRLNRWSLQLEALTQTPRAIVTSIQTSGSTLIPDAGAPISRTFNFYSLHGPLSVVTLTTDIAHTYPGDLQISLVAPGGMTVTVSRNNGLLYTNSFGNGITGTVWYDAAGQVNPPGAVTDAHYVSNKVQPALAPQEAFGVLQTRNPTGLWQLLVQDTAPDDVGHLYAARLQLATYTCLPSLGIEHSLFPAFPKLGGPASLGWGITNNGALAHNLVTTATLSGPFPFQGVVGYDGLACSAPALGSLNAAPHCSLASLGNIGEPGVTVTYSTPLVPTSAPFTVSVTSSEADLYSGDNYWYSDLVAFAHSANGNPWDVLDAKTRSYATRYGTDGDDGSIVDGGQDAFDRFGQISVRVFTGPNAALDADISGLGLTYAAGSAWHTTTPQTVGPVTIQRSLLAPTGQDWLRYLDTFTNNDVAAHTVWVAWGGDLGSDDKTEVRATSSGDLNLNAADTWAVTDQAFAGGYSPDAVLGYALRAAGDTSYQGPFHTATPITSSVWSGTGDQLLSHVYKLSLAPGATMRLAYFVYRGLAETSGGPADCDFYGGCVSPAAGAQVALVHAAVAALVANGPFCDLSPAVRATIVNWPGIGGSCKSVFLPVVKK